MNLRIVLVGFLLLLGSTAVFLDTAMVASRPPLLAGSLAAMATFFGAAVLSTSENRRAA